MANSWFRRIVLASACTALVVSLLGRVIAADDGLGSLNLSGSSDDDGQLTVRAKFFPAKDKAPARLSITADIPAGWHTFSITQRAGGPNPTKIKLDTSTQWKLAGEFTADPAPQIENDPATPVPMEEHTGRVTWTAPIEISAGVDPKTLLIKGKVNAQLCSNHCLFPTDYPFISKYAGPDAAASEKSVQGGVLESNHSATGAFDAPHQSGASDQALRPGPGTADDNSFNTGGPSGVPNNSAAAVAANAEPPQIGEFKAPGIHATLRGWVEPSVVSPGGKAKFTLVAEPEPGYHVYELAPRDADSLGKPTLIAFNRGLFAKAVQPMPDRAPKPDPAAKPGSGELPIYDAPVRWSLSIDIPASAAVGSYPISGVIGYQTCSGARCDLPLGARFEGKLIVGRETVAGQSPLLFRPAKYIDAAKLANATAPADAKAASATGAGATASADQASELSLPVVLVFSLLGGLILNLMPCVLPVIGLKVLSFVEQAGQSRARVLTLNAWYSTGLILVFMVLASMAAFGKLAWGEHFQSPVFNIVLSGVVFAMALSFLGVWEIPIPGFVGSGKAADAAAQEGAFGALAKGALTTVLATPCSGPYLGAVFFYALKQPPAVIYLVFGAIGLGMASPYLLIGMFPRLIRFLPRPGAWMDTFKQLMGFLLLGTVVYLFTLLQSDYVVPTFALLIGIWFGCWWVGRTPLTAELPRKLQAWGIGAASAAVIGVVAFRVLLAGPALLDWQPYSQTKLDELTTQGKTVMIDFTANWCPTCKWNLKFAINTPGVRKAVDANDVTPLVADWTSYSQEIKDKLNSLGSNSIPVLAIYPAGRASQPIVLRDLVSESDVIRALEQAGPSRKAVAASGGSRYLAESAAK